MPENIGINNNNGPRPTVRPGRPVGVIGAPKEKKSSFTAFAEAFLRSFRVILVLLIAALLCGGAFGLYSLYVENIVTVKGLIGEKEKLLGEKEAELAKLKSIKIDMEDLQGPAQKIMGVLPVQKDLPGIFIQLEALALKNNLFMAGVDVAEDKAASKKKTPLQKLTINVSLTGGDYFALKNFLADMEKNLRLLDVQSIAYAPETRSFNLGVITYFYSD